MNTLKFLALTVCAISLSGCAQTLAFLDEDENGKTFEQRAVADSLSTIGVTPREKPSIEYKERKGLAMPKAASALPRPIETPNTKAMRAKSNEPVPIHSTMKPVWPPTYEEQQAEREAGAQLVKTSDDTKVKHPLDMSYSDWRAGEDKARQGDMAKGAPVQPYSVPSAQDWHADPNKGAVNADISALNSADKSRKTLYDPPSRYKEPAPMDNLSPEALARVKAAEKKSNWLPF